MQGLELRLLALRLVLQVVVLLGEVLVLALHLGRLVLQLQVGALRLGALGLQLVDLARELLHLVAALLRFLLRVGEVGLRKLLGARGGRERREADISNTSTATKQTA